MCVWGCRTSETSETLAKKGVGVGRVRSDERRPHTHTHTKSCDGHLHWDKSESLGVRTKFWSHFFKKRLPDTHCQKNGRQLKRRAIKEINKKMYKNRPDWNGNNLDLQIERCRRTVKRMYCPHTLPVWNGHQNRSSRRLSWVQKRRSLFPIRIWLMLFRTCFEKLIIKI